MKQDFSVFFKLEQTFCNVKSSAFTLGRYLAVRPTVGVGRVVVGRVLPRDHVLLANLAHLPINTPRSFISVNLHQMNC